MPCQYDIEPKYSRSDDDGEHDDEDEEKDETPGDHVSEYEFDIDTLQHQREIALAYFEKRNTIGADAARSMSGHTHKLAGEDDEWEQEASVTLHFLFLLSLLAYKLNGGAYRRASTQTFPIRV
ncbi:hypothetical protein B0F90DRAFT_1824848 [Multifurca ochricompacta]|uniref:Uncharacterized protein n=1 Tax=Multifurca ochricompacta TaxID=376703 RepID=A0AAD4LU40_9AGAM|nr:hypothetical protein B0F90DRAFT_1824848 [Multifurca ochricompacta]